MYKHRPLYLSITSMSTTCTTFHTLSLRSPYFRWSIKQWGLAQFAVSGATRSWDPVAGRKTNIWPRRSNPPSTSPADDSDVTGSRLIDELVGKARSERQTIDFPINCPVMALYNPWSRGPAVSSPQAYYRGKRVYALQVVDGTGPRTASPFLRFRLVNADRQGT